MPELPEVEILVRHLRPLIQGKTVREVNVRRAKSLRGTKEKTFKKALTGARFTGLTRRGKYLLFELRPKGARDSFQMLGHLGMTGRMYLQPKGADLAKHAAVVLALGRHDFVFEDTRYFGRLTLDLSSIDALGPEPLSENFTVDYFHGQLKRSAQPIKVKLLDQTLVAGIGNIYAGEALFHSGISPRRQSRRLARAQTALLLENVQRILSDAIALGSSIKLDFEGSGKKDGLFYYGSSAASTEAADERFAVYGREGQPCPACATPIKRIVQAARSAFFCPKCQRG
jgi:formamidopyrimidine-DNA glycosylase